MKNKQNISENLEKEAPFLSKIKKENHFSSPKNYFESLPEVMSNKNLNNKSLHFLFDKLSWKILVPFTAVVIIFTIVTNWNTPIDPNSILTNEQLSEYIINEDYIAIDDYIIYESYAEMIEQEEDNDVENQEYINYLLENDIDINSIIEEL